MTITIASGIDIGPGITLGGTGGGTAGVDNVTGYDEMPGPVTAGLFGGSSLQDETATINDPIGFTINNDLATGIALQNLSLSNQAFFANYGTGTRTCTWGPGSTVASSTINVIQIVADLLVFEIQGQTGPATYNYPFTFS